MRVARAQAQAKINLLLRIGSRAPTGYHQVSTIFQRIDLADEIVVRVGGNTRSIDCGGFQLPAGGLGPAEKNLAYRAATAYAERVKWIRGFAIEVTKHIPVGGGLGGGSADAGAVLRALQAMSPDAMSISPMELQDIAVALGADVHFLASDHARALGLNYGELIRRLEPLSARSVVLAVPRFGVSTADAYAWLDETGGGTLGNQVPAGFTADDLEFADWDSMRRYSQNDFETVVEARHPELGELRQRLGSAGAAIARLSGSGSTVYGVFDGPAPDPKQLGLDALTIPTRTSARVVQVEVLE